MEESNLMVNAEQYIEEKKYKALANKLEEISVRSRYMRLLCWSVASMALVTMTAVLLRARGGWARAGGGDGSGEPALVCYYARPAAGDMRALLPRDINPHLCTHINIAFARVNNNTIQLDDDLIHAVSEVVKLKADNPKLKILLSIGGARGDNGFPNMVVNHANRKVFIKSMKYVLRNYTLDGIDLDWEFPAIHDYVTSDARGQNMKNNIYGKKERQHFSQLLHEIRSEYIREKRNYLLTVAVAAPETIVNMAYDIDQLEMYADFVNIMTYDYHFYNKYTPFTGLNSPLFARPEEQLLMATLNMNYTVNMYISKGLSRNKIVVGIPTYGHTFTLVNPDNTAIGSPVSGFGSLGSQGFVNYPDICQFIKAYKSEVTVKLDESAKVPYLYRDQEWVSYDTPQSVVDKVDYIRQNGLQGAMIYSLNADDYAGKCAQDTGNDVKFPLVQAARNTLIGTPKTKHWRKK